MSAAAPSGRARVVWAEGGDGGYFDWRRSRVRVRGLEVHLYEKPGQPGYGQLDVAAALLAEHLPIDGGMTLLDLNCGSGLAGATAAQLGAGHVLLADANLLAAQAARRTLEANQIENGAVFVSSGTRAIGEFEPADLVSIRLPRGTHLARQLIWDAYRALRPGGQVILAGGKREGIRPALALLEEQFGSASILAYRKGFRVGAARLEGPPGPPAWPDPWLDPQVVHRFAVEVRGRSIQVCTRPGVFAWDRLDPGTRALIEALELAEDHQVLDLGCGNGVVGAACALETWHGQVVLVDADINAVESARLTVEANGLENCQVLLSDCAEAVQGRKFDVVAANPPFHARREAGFQIAYQFINDACRVLRPGGRLYLVANRFLAYEDLLRRQFGGVREVAGDSRFKVLLATKNGDG